MTSADHDRRAAQIMTDHLAHTPVEGPVLLVSDPTPHLGRALDEVKQEWQRWDRRFTEGRSPTPWPQGGPYKTALVRLPRSNDELTLTLHAVRSMLTDDGSLYLFGANDEGIKSAGKRLAPLFDQSEAIATKHHSRLWQARATQEKPRAPFSAWKQVNMITTPQGDIPLVSYPGLFAKGILDPGTALLLENFPTLKDEACVLDFACGTGVIAAAVRLTKPRTALSILDNDRLALEAACGNVPDAKLINDNKLCAALPKFDLIISNPPLHSGKSQTFDILEDLCVKAPDHLTKKGALLIVVQRATPAQRLLEASFKKVDLQAENRSYRIWRGEN